jgi:hypothetical protein
MSHGAVPGPSGGFSLSVSVHQLGNDLLHRLLRVQLPSFSPNNPGLYWEIGRAGAGQLTRVALTRPLLGEKLRELPDYINHQQKNKPTILLSPS